jgi:Aerotolerance regulator N-terminal/von Willebrand factor type A domain
VNFAHVSLLAGSALILVPVILHFLGRREPKRITFPALRFVRQTAIQAQRGWSIKRWLLLAIRILLVLLAALTFASPRVHSSMHATYLCLGLIAILALLASAAALLSIANRHPRSVWMSIAGLSMVLWLGLGVWGTWTMARGAAAPTQASIGPICVAFVIDTSPTMDYRQANQSRLEVAKETVGWIMDRMPGESQIAIVTSTQGQRLHPGRLSANQQLEKVKVDGQSTDLPARIRSAIELVRSSKIDRREIYVLTDLSIQAWSTGDSDNLADMLKPNQEENVLVQLIDLGPKKRENWSLGNLKLSQEIVTPGSSVDVTASISASPDTAAGQVAVELFVEQRDPRLPIVKNGEAVFPKSAVRDRQTLDVPAGGKVDVRFSLRDIEAGTTHAELRLSRPDPLAVDNQLSFTIEAIEPNKQLVIGNEDGRGNNQALLAARMLNPELKRVEIHTYGELSTLELTGFDSILLVDPPKLSEDDVTRLQSAVESGKGLLLVLGRAMNIENAWKESATLKLLPGKISRLWRKPMTDDSHYFVSLKPSHPVWSLFGQTSSSVPWNIHPIYKYWVIDKLAEDASVLVNYSDSGHPAVIEQLRGAGRILTITTPTTDPDSIENPPWNRLWATTNPWPNFGLMVGAMQYLSGTGNARRNFQIGNPPMLDNPIERLPTRYDLFSPNGEVVRVQTQGNHLHYAYAQQAGVYRLRSVQADRPALRGFSMQLDPRTVNLEQIDLSVLDRVLGKDQYFLVSNREGLQSSIGQARHGKDLAPFLFVVLFLIALAEQAMSYRFYSLGTKAVA